MAGAIILATCSSVGVAWGVDYATRESAMPVSSVLFLRGLFGLALLLIYLRPMLADLRPLEPTWALFRLVSGGLTFVGWFGAIACLSASVATALFMIDVLLLGIIRNFLSHKADVLSFVFVFSMVLLYISVACVNSPPVFDLANGIAFAVVGIVARTFSQQIWERHCKRGEKQVLRIGIPFAGSVVTSLPLGGYTTDMPSPILGCVILATALFGLVGYLTGDYVLSKLGAYRSRLLELTTIPALVLIDTFRTHSLPNPATLAAVALLALATAWALARSRGEELTASAGN